jgi:uncharacterized protein (DUF2141 family)
MKKIVFGLAALSVLFLSPQIKTAPKKLLVLTIENIKDHKAPILVGVFTTPEDFPDKAVYREYIAYPSYQQDKAILTIPDLDYGHYALSMFQDKNNDRKLNTNFIGIPTEPYAFSNNIRPRFTAPSFQDCSFRYDEGYHRISVSLIH